MGITVTSNFETPKAEVAPKADMAKESEKEETSVADLASAESTEESETSENENLEDGDELDANAQDDQEDSEESKKDDEKKPKRSRNQQVKRKIDRLTRELSEKDRRIAILEDLALKGKSPEKQEPVEAKADAKTAQDGKPKAEDFDSHEEFVDALTDWKLEQREKAKEAKQKTEEIKTTQQKRMESHQARVAEFAKTQADYQSVVEEFVEDYGDANFSPGLTEAIIESELGPQVMFELFKNPKEFERINKLSVVAAAREVGRLEERLKGESESPKIEKKQTKAPAPLKPLGSKSAGSVKKSIYDPNISQKEFEALIREQQKQRAWGS